MAAPAELSSRLTSFTRTTPAVRLAAIAGPPLVAYLLGLIYKDYSKWYSLGQGGIAHNLLGYLIQNCLRVFASSDTRSLKPYMSSKLVSVYYRSHNASYLESLPQRTSEPPDVPSYVAPQRQTSQASSTEVRQKTVRSFNEFAANNPELVRLGLSKLEGGRGPAYFLPSAGLHPPFTAQTKGEIAHIHSEADGSGHVLLVPRDAKEVLKKGWGERHMLSGFGIPIGYTMVYAPRDDSEIEVFMTIMEAAAYAASPTADLR